VFAQTEDKKDAPPKDPEKKEAPADPDPMSGGRPLSYWKKQLKDNDKKARQEAVAAIARLRGRATSASDEALEMLKDEKDEYNRQLGAYLLAYIKPDPKKAGPALVAALKDKDPAVRRPAATALAVLGGKAKATTPALLDLLKDKDPDQRQLAAYVLGHIEPEPHKETVQALVFAAKDPSDLVRKMAVESLKKIDPQAAAGAGIQ
jgi:HEAT repeat protein